MKKEQCGPSVHSDYLIQGIEILLDESCVLQRYYPLIPYKKQLVRYFIGIGCLTKAACLLLPEEVLLAAGLPDRETAALFRRFLCLYDYKGKGIRDIPEAQSKSEEEISSLLELMRLPGVKGTRAELYYCCGMRSLADFAAADADPLREMIAKNIEQKALPYSLPLPKELRTQIAVAKVFTKYSVDHTATIR